MATQALITLRHSPARIQVGFMTGALVLVSFVHLVICIFHHLNISFTLYAAFKPVVSSTDTTPPVQPYVSLRWWTRRSILLNSMMQVIKRASKRSGLSTTASRAPWPYTYFMFSPEYATPAFAHQATWIQSPIPATLMSQWLFILNSSIFEHSNCTQCFNRAMFSRTYCELSET